MAAVGTTTSARRGSSMRARKSGASRPSRAKLTANPFADGFASDAPLDDAPGAPDAESGAPGATDDTPPLVSFSGSRKRDQTAKAQENLGGMVAETVSNVLILATARIGGGRRAITPDEAATAVGAAGRVVARHVPVVHGMSPDATDGAIIVLTFLHWLARLMVDAMSAPRVVSRPTGGAPAPAPQMAPGASETPLESFDLRHWDNVPPGAGAPSDGPLGAPQGRSGGPGMPPVGGVDTMSYAQDVGPHDLGQGALA